MEAPPDRLQEQNRPRRSAKLKKEKAKAFGGIAGSAKKIKNAGVELASGMYR